MDCDPRLQKLLDEHGISLELFRKKGRPPAGHPHLFAIRRAIVTYLHAHGMSWHEMCQVTGLSIPGIARLTEAKGCEAVKENRRAVAARNGHLGKGRTKPELSERLRKAWEAGEFDFHKGRVRAEWEVAKLRASFTEERRKSMAEAHTLKWQDPQYRETLLAYHRSPEQRAARSAAQSERTVANPQVRGLCGWAHTLKGSKDVAWYRSSYELAAFEVLDQDPLVWTYDIEPVIRLPIGRTIMPDLLVHFFDGPPCLVEVKASWVLSQPVESKVRIRLRWAEEYATSQGWRFEVWTEKDRLSDAISRSKVKACRSIQGR
jgi:hypothetical protein